MVTLFTHVVTFQYWSAAGYQSYRIAAGMGINTKKSLLCHLVNYELSNYELRMLWLPYNYRL